MNTARPPEGDSVSSGASAPDEAAASVAGGLGASTEAASAVGFETAMALADVPEATAAVTVPSGNPVSDFMTHRVARALRERVRYRYVAPRVLREGQNFRIQSPCCSRNVDPSGGLIDIALLTPSAAGTAEAVGTADMPGATSMPGTDGMPGVADMPSTSAGTVGCWSLSARDHAAGSWVQRMSGESLDTVLDALCVDSERQFWP